MPIFKPLRCAVLFLILEVVSCKSNKVLPQDGQEMYSVFEILVLVACKMPKDVELISITGNRKIFGFNKKVMGQL